MLYWFPCQRKPVASLTISRILLTLSTFNRSGHLQKEDDVATIIRAPTNERQGSAVIAPLKFQVQVVLHNRLYAARISLSFPRKAVMRQPAPDQTLFIGLNALKAIPV
jgi:hypothetical protein